MDYNNLFIKKRKTFLDAVENFVSEQENVLQTIISNNTETKYGINYDFKSLKTVKDFQKKIPITKYEDYESYIKEIIKGKKNILTSEDVLLLEPTGGSTTGSKYIPYTLSLKKAFNKGLEPWLSDLFLNFPIIVNNPMYWSITPSTEAKKMQSAVPVGFDNDLDYLYPPFSDIISNQIIIPDIKNCSIDEFYSITLEELKAKENIAFISIWNPTLLLNILEKEQYPEKIWKNLQIVSCWDESNAKIYSEKLKIKLPQTYIQGKGLLATEGIMTIPIEGIGKIPCVQSHFYEFIDVKTEKVLLLNELEDGKEYSILLTTQGGLYRYRIGDIVKVESKYKNCPLMSFVRRENNISDYFGEKLNEDFVKSIIKKSRIESFSDFYMFAPYCDKKVFYYTIYYDGKCDVQKISFEIENELKQNYHYKYARELGQIKEFRLKKIKNGLKQYIENCIKKGQKLGDIKPIIFSNSVDWEFKIEEE